MGGVSMRVLVVAVVAALALALPISASASVRLVSVTSPIRAGSTATLVVKVSTRATCSITVEYKSGPSVAQGLYPKRVTAAGRVGWSWKVGTRTTPGRWPIVVSCGRAGTLRASFLVL
jgi:hypothetical protein